MLLDIAYGASHRSVAIISLVESKRGRAGVMVSWKRMELVVGW